MSGRKGRLPQKPCSECGTSIDRRVKSGLCKVCVRKPCGDCGATLGPKNRSGYCSRCNTARLNADPEFSQLRLNGIRRKWEDPDFLEAQRRRCQRMGQKFGIDPDMRARRVAWGKFAYASWLSKPEIRERANTSPLRGKKVSEARMGWCPPEMRERYRYLTHSKKMLAADARKVIELEWADKQALKHVDSALYHLQKIAPVHKLENGYRVGNSPILRPSEVVERAKLRGWQPESWAA